MISFDSIFETVTQKFAIRCKQFWYIILSRYNTRSPGGFHLNILKKAFSISLYNPFSLNSSEEEHFKFLLRLSMQCLVCRL